MAKIEIEESALDSLKAMVQQLQEQRDILLEATKFALATVEDERIGTSDYMEGSQIYNDFEKAATIAKSAIAACTETKQVLA